MRHVVIAGMLAALAMSAAPSPAQPGPPPPPPGHPGPPPGPPGPPPPDHGPGWRDDGPRDYRRYDYDRPDPRYGDYQADRYYRRGGNYRARRLGPDDRIYRGQDNRYYCRRADGTTGLIIGGLGGGVLGNVIAPGGSKTLGTLLGGVAGGLLGRSVDRNKVTCR